jgi:hypothetical protein
MTHLLVYNLRPSGLIGVASLYQYNDGKFKFIKYYYEIENIYGDVYFLQVNADFLSNDIIDKELLVKTNVNPLWIHEEINGDIYYIYAVKLLIDEELWFPVNTAEEPIFKYISNRYGNNIHYFLTQSYKHRRIYLVEPINKEEALRIMNEYEPIILWELI